MKRLIGVITVLVFGLGLFGASFNMRGEINNINKSSASDNWVIDENTKAYEIADYDLSKYVTLGDIDNISVEVPYTEVTDEFVIEKINEIVAEYPGHRVIDKTTVENGDIVNISYVGTIDGIEFEGGSDDNGFVTIGSGSMVPGFEEGILGLNVGETKSVNVTFPDNYYAEYAGKDAVFEITVKAIVEEVQMTYENIDDAFVMDTFGVETVQELFDQVKNYHIEDSESHRKSDAFDAIMNKVMEISEVNVPKELLDYKVLSYLAQLKSGIEKAGMSVDVYLANYYQMTEEEFYTNVEGIVKESLEKQMVLSRYAETKGIELDEEAYASYKMSFMQYYGYADEEALYKDYPESEIKTACLCNQVSEHLLDVIDIDYIAE
ncbi:MAG: trigger factor [Lachnospiraceae bacterium]|nr:trigger factor [Lachnospiraceae bacterium]